MEECQDILLSQKSKWLGNKCSIPFVQNKNQNKHTNKDYKDLRGNPPLFTMVVTSEEGNVIGVIVKKDSSFICVV